MIKTILTPLEKAADFNQGPVSFKASASAKPPSAQTIRKSISLTGLTLVLLASATIAPIFAAEFPFVGSVNSADINIRTGPNTSYESLNKLKKDTEVKVINEHFDWYKIILPEGNICFISRNFVQVNNADFSQGLVTANKVNLRAKPDETGAILGQINKDSKIKILKTYPKWYSIAAPQGLAFGWVHKKFIDYKKQFMPVTLANNEDSQKITLKLAPLASGTVRPLGIFFKRKGSHKLVIDKKTAYYLKGDKELLNSVIGYKVNVFGEIFAQSNVKIPLIEVKRIEISQ